MSKIIPVTTVTKRAVIARLLKPEILREPGAWPREMKIMNELASIYQSDSFWKRSELDFSLNSLAYFKTPNGAEALSNLWTVFHFCYPDIALDNKALLSDNGPDGKVCTPSLELPSHQPDTVAKFLSKSS